MVYFWLIIGLVVRNAYFCKGRKCLTELWKLSFLLYLWFTWKAEKRFSKGRKYSSGKWFLSSFVKGFVYSIKPFTVLKISCFFIRISEAHPWNRSRWVGLYRILFHDALFRNKASVRPGSRFRRWYISRLLSGRYSSLHEVLRIRRTDSLPSGFLLPIVGYRLLLRLAPSSGFLQYECFPNRQYWHRIFPILLLKCFVKMFRLSDYFFMFASYNLLIW